MVSKISYLVIFGIIVFANGSPAYRQDPNHGEPQYDLKQLLGELAKQGKYDVMLNHHEDRPGSHHEDITQLTYNGEKPNSQYQASSAKNLNYNSIPSTPNLNLFLGKKFRTLQENNKGKTKEEADDVVTFLKDLDNTLKVNGGNNLELRCSGNRCGESRDESGNSNRDDNQNIINNNDRNLRCNGKRCSVAIDIDRNDRNNLRCYGNRCSRSASDRDNNDGDDRNDRVSGNRDILNIFRCSGGKCGINRDDDDDDDDDDDNDREDTYTLRCEGDRCGINRDNDDDEDDRDGIDSFHCVGDRCGINRDGIDALRCVGSLCSINRDDNDDDDDDDDDTDTLRCTGKSCSRNRNDNYGIDTLHCIGDRCSRDRDDVREDRNDDRDEGGNLRCTGDRCGRHRDDDDKDNLRCIGNRCGRSRIDSKNQGPNYEYQNVDEAEAIVDNLLSNYAKRANEYSSFEGSDKKSVMKQVKTLLANLKNGLIRVVHGIVGLKPPSARLVNL